MTINKLKDILFKYLWISMWWAHLSTSFYPG